jgi:glycosyltransferase involved in cell wall biosynthesis
MQPDQTQAVEDGGVSVVIPAYNEEASIGSGVEEVRKAMDDSGRPYEIIVVDDGSSDRTGEIAAALSGIRLLTQPMNRGYGAALKAGIKVAKYQTIVITDADGTYPADQLPKMLEIGKDYDMVVGARIGANVSIPLVRRPAKWFLTRLASLLAGRNIPDLNSGLRVINRAHVLRFQHLLPSGFSFTTTISLAMLCTDQLVFYHPINYMKRAGVSKMRAKHAFEFLVLIVRIIVYFNPLKVFLPLGGVFMGLGLAKFVYDIGNSNLSEAAILGILGGTLLWSLGLLSDQIARSTLRDLNQ